MSVSAESPVQLRPSAAGLARARTQRLHRSSCLGPLLAVCGTAGGVGTTTVAYIVASAAACQWREPVLVADTGGPSGGLAAIAGVEAPRSLPELADHLATGLPLRDGIYATGSADLRVLATGPEFSTSCPDPQFKRLLRDAREAHALTVIDCGTLARQADHVTIGAATHIAWVMPTAGRGACRAERVLAAAPPVSAKPILIARGDARDTKVSVKELRRLGSEQGAPLVLLPQLTGVEGGATEQVMREAQISSQAILGVLTR
jgi:hypothetical protein